ncbi:MAG TPA: hypothetical protein DDX98_00220 [Bacteroidales bacterium]|jgi:uncharacterized protein YbjT (DUF2867 family)|nr:hypothetical protein [Bacteroidales bacterium]
MKKHALVFGGTGLVGSYLLEELAGDPGYDSITSCVRTPKSAQNSRVKEVVVDFDKLKDNRVLFQADEVFICLGTTIKKAGSVANMEKIDRDLPVEIAQMAREGGVKKLAVVSSIGANESASNYYLRIKGEMEHGIRTFDFENIVIVRPSIILGNRKEKRFGESVGRALIKSLSFLLIGRLRRYRGIHARTIAKAMINIFKQDLQEVIYESDELSDLAR